MTITDSSSSTIVAMARRRYLRAFTAPAPAHAAAAGGRNTISGRGVSPMPQFRSLNVYQNTLTLKRGNKSGNNHGSKRLLVANKVVGKSLKPFVFGS